LSLAQPVSARACWSEGREIRCFAWAEDTHLRTELRIARQTNSAAFEREIRKRLDYWAKLRREPAAK